MDIKLKKNRVLRIITLLLSFIITFGSAVFAILYFDGTAGNTAAGILVSGFIVSAGIGFAVFSGCFFEKKRKLISFEATLLIFIVYVTATSLFTLYNIRVSTCIIRITNKNRVLIDIYDSWFLTCFLFICVPLAVAITFCVERFIASLRENGFAANSLLVRLVRFITAGKSIRRILLIYIILAALSAVIVNYLFWFVIGFDKLSVLDPLLSVFMPGFTAVVIFLSVILLLTMRRKSVVSDMETICNEINAISDDASLYNSSISEKSLLYPTAKKLISFGDTVRESIKKGIASEKMKVKLISNVSHDLKTPLTAIIGYGELLQKEKLPVEAAAYADKLTYKSKYLMELVEDIFELSKTASGNALINKTELDLRKLLEQSLAELYDKAEEIGAEFVLSLSDAPVSVITDGARMHRVFQNLLDNAIKYSLKGTRIYITLAVGDNSAEVEIINTASYKMDFSPETITERFVRGDEARSGEGSGLGLAIAKTYTEACEGTLTISVKGDQFTATVMLPLKPTDN